MLLHILAKLGCGFDCASKDEIILAKSTGVSTDNLLYANPVKDNESLQFARSQDVDYLTFDTCCELDKIKVCHPDAKCIIRIQVDDSGSECQFNTKFGCTLEEVKELLELAKIDKINIVGTSFHCGSNCKVKGQFMNAIRDAKKVFDIAKNYGFTLNILDIGGGFPGCDDDVITFEQIADEINKAIDMYFNDIDVKFIAEPGRMFSASSHTLVATIIGIKNSISIANEEIFKYTLNDGVYGSFNCIIFDHAVPKILPFNERTEKTYKSTLFGPSCDSIDVITKDAELPKLAIGDRVFVLNFGAYTKASSSSFNGFRTTLNYYITKI
jgi:ornithine decarboxylase